MKVNRIIEIPTYINKNRVYLYNEVFSLSREHKCFYGSEFGKNYITVGEPSETFIDTIKRLGIKFRSYINESK